MSRDYSNGLEGFGDPTLTGESPASITEGTAGVGKLGKKGSTPGHKLRVMMDDWIPVVVKPFESFHKEAQEMNKQANAYRFWCVLKPNGWQIESFLYDRQIYSDVQTPDGSVRSPGQLTVSNGGLLVASGYAEVNTAGPTRAGDTRAVGDTGVKKRTASAATLASDQAAFPASDTTLRGQTMQRGVKTASNHDVDREILIEIRNSGDPGKFTKPRRVLFQGPLYRNKDFYGVGDYQCDVTDDGVLEVYAKLFKNSDNSLVGWKRILARKVVAGHLTTVHIHIQTLTSPRGRKLLSITVTGAGVMNHHDLEINTPNDAETASPAVLAAVAPSYQAVLPIPMFDTGSAMPARVGQPLRVEVGPRERATIVITESLYRPQGQVDDTWSFTYPRGTDEDIYLLWSHHKPAGTDVSAQVFDIKHDPTFSSPLTILEQHSYNEYGWIRFRPAHAESFDYRVLYTLHANDEGTKTPTLHYATPYVFALFDTPDVHAFNLVRRSDPPSPTTDDDGNPVDPPAENASGHPLRIVRNYSAHSGGLEMLGSASALEMHDLDGSGGAVRTRSMVATTVWHDYPDPGNPSNTKSALLFRGYSVNPQSVRQKRRTGRDYPSDHWRQNNLVLVPELTRARQTLGRVRFPWLHTDGTTFKVTERIKWCLGNLYPPEYIDIPDLGVPLPLDKRNNTLAPQTNLGDLIEADARDYFSSKVDFDKGADKVRMFQPPLSSTKPLARFLTKSSLTSSTVTSLKGNTIPCVAARPFPVYGYEGPLVNAVIVVGNLDSKAATDQGHSSGLVMVQKAFRFQAYNAFGLPKNHKFYPRPIQPPDATASADDHTVAAFKTHDYMPNFAPLWYKDIITDPKLMDWLTRRIYLNCCFGRNTCTLRSGLVLVLDPDDTGQIRERELREMDKVELENSETGDIESWIVRRCTVPPSKKSYDTETIYELVRPEWPEGEYGVIENHRSVIQNMKRTAKVALGTDPDHPIINAASQASNAFADRFGGMVQQTQPPIQNYDPTSDDFGKLLAPPSWS